MRTMPRTYRMKARAESVEETRRKVLESARQAILDGPSPVITMGDVARRAGVARSTLYSTYGSLGGLVGAVMVDAQMRGGFDRVLALFNLADAAEAMRRALPEGARMYATDYELARRVRVLARLEPTVMEGEVIGEEMRAGGMRYQAGRLAEQGKLRPGDRRARRQAAVAAHRLRDVRGPAYNVGHGRGRDRRVHRRGRIHLAVARLAVFAHEVEHPPPGVVAGVLPLREGPVEKAVGSVLVDVGLEGHACRLERGLELGVLLRRGCRVRARDHQQQGSLHLRDVGLAAHGATVETDGSGKVALGRRLVPGVGAAEAEPDREHRLHCASFLRL